MYGEADRISDVRASGSLLYIPVKELSRASALQKTRYIESVMREAQIQSVAFRNAELDSERLRIFGVVSFFAIFMLITVVRVFVIGTASGAALSGAHAASIG